MPLTSTQIGTVGENLLVNAVMVASEGRLAPFQPIADDDGLDVLFFDKITGRAIAVQLKCRTSALAKKGTDQRGNVIHFEVRKSTFNDARRAYLVAGLLNKDFSRFEVTWLVPMSDLPQVASHREKKWVLRPSKAGRSADRYSGYRCNSDIDLAQRIIALCEEDALLIPSALP